MSAAAVPTPDQEVQKYARMWGVSFAAVQRAIPGAVCEVLTQAPPGIADSDPRDLWISATSQGKSRGSVSLRINPKTAMQLLQGAASVASGAELTDENKAWLLDCVRKTADGVTEAAPLEIKDELLVEFRDAAPASKVVALWLQFRGDAGEPLLVEIWLDEALVGWLTQPIGSIESAMKPIPETGGQRLGMLMDVELVVAVRFGGKRMLLKDILDLCAGSVVELDQHIQEPVDLLLDGKLIARGEVVVVDGNYGLRVSEVVSRPER